MKTKFLGLIKDNEKEPFIYLREDMQRFTLPDIFFYSLQPHQNRIEIRTINKERADARTYLKNTFETVVNNEKLDDNAKFYDLWSWSQMI